MKLIDACKQNGYAIDESNTDAVNAISKYFETENKKGLLLQGYYGTGKTWIMRLINQFIEPVKIVSSETILNDVIFDGGVPSKYLKKSEKLIMHEGKILCADMPHCFDELGGHNDRKVNIWGNEIYPMSLILKTHYEKNIKCHAITNYMTEDLVKLYGGEVVDRFSEMFITVKFKGGSRRK